MGVPIFGAAAQIECYVTAHGIVPIGSIVAQFKCERSQTVRMRLWLLAKLSVHVVEAATCCCRDALLPATGLVTLPCTVPLPR